MNSSSIKFTTQKRYREEDNENKDKSEDKMEIENEKEKEKDKNDDNNKNKLSSPFHQNKIIFNQNSKEDENKQKKEKEIQSKETTKIETDETKINNNIMPLNEDINDTGSKNNDDKKKTKKRIKERKKEEFDKYIIKIKKKNSKDIEVILNDGFVKFEQLKYEWDIFFLIIILVIQNELKNFEAFLEDYSYYIYNNLRGIKTCKDFVNIMKNPPNKKRLYEEAALLYQKRNKLFFEIAGKYNIKLLKHYIDALNKSNINPNTNTNNIPNPNNNSAQNANNNNNQNTNNNNTTQNVTNNNTPMPNQNNQNNQNTQNNTTNIINNEAIASFNLLKEDFKIELFVAALVYNSLIRNEKEQEKFDKDLKKDKQSINPIKFEVINNNLGEESMIAVISGIKFNNNIVEINLSGNMLGPKCLFWLGGVFKTNPNINVLDLTRCNIDNDALYLFIEGTKFANESLNYEQLNLNKLILKDNNQITDTTNDKFEHPLGLILRKFKLKWLNLTNAKLKNSGTCKFLRVFLELMKENKIFMENLVLICNEFCNEECLSILGEIIEQKNICPLKNLILSKNQISTPVPNSSDKINHFDIFMKKVAQSNLKELFLINCSIGKNENDIQILYDMLCQNKSLISIRLFGNEISNMKDFSNILGIFSEYNNGLKNNTLKSLDLSKNNCNIKIDDAFLQLIEKLKLEYLDINQNTMDPNEKDIFRNRTNELNDIKIIY